MRPPIHASERGLSVYVSSPTGPRAIGYEWSRFGTDDRATGRCF